MHEDIGAQLRAERERLGISLRALARKVGISPSALSQIEIGRSRPTVSTLYGIVTELNMSLDELFNHRSAAPPNGANAVPGSVAHVAGPVLRRGQRRLIDLDSAVRWERLTPSHDPDVEFLFVTYAVGGSSSRDRTFLRHPGHEYGLVIDGSLTVSTSFDTHELGPGDSISFDSMLPHLLENRGDVPVTAVWVVVGREHDPRAAVLDELKTP
jgi:transcriptional regulator with XRE-family HTH domain